MQHVNEFRPIATIEGLQYPENKYFLVGIDVIAGLGGHRWKLLSHDLDFRIRLVEINGKFHCKSFRDIQSHFGNVLLIGLIHQ